MGYIVPRLMAAWRSCQSPRPNFKEIQESLAFFEKTRRVLGRKHVVIDAAGGHGALALAFGASGYAQQAIVADLRRPPSFENLRAAWKEPHTEVEYNVLYENIDLSDSNWLKALLNRTGVIPSKAAVVSIHACGTLTDALIDTCVDAHVDFAVMPCCHGRGKDPHHQKLKDAANVLEIPLAIATDMARFGAINSRGYTAKLRTIDPKITPENHILIGLCEHGNPRVADEQRRVLQRITAQWRKFEEYDSRDRSHARL